MSEHPLLFGFGTEKPSEDYPMEFISHHLIGDNPDDEDGYWDSREKAIHFFATEFLYIARRARHQFLFVRTPPELFSGDDKKSWRMIGRFSIAKLKEKNNG